MNSRLWLPILFFVLWIDSSHAAILGNHSPQMRQKLGRNKQSRSDSSLCPPAALSRLRKHTIVPGETLANIAAQYDLIEATVIGMNPVFRNGTAPVGTQLVIPPYNGIRIEVSPGSTWQNLAETYNVRADALFEVNGCQPPSRFAFIPGVNWSPSEVIGTQRGGESKIATQELSSYPLPSESEVLVSYGWVLTPRNSEAIFHSGLDLRSSEGTPVVAAGAGTVAFAAEQGIYGNLVVINHDGGLQTRYAHLGSIEVQRGQQVQGGTPLGTVGTTGTPDADEPHLHFEVRYNSDLGWVAEDPQGYLRSMSVMTR